MDCWAEYADRIWFRSAAVTEKCDSAARNIAFGLAIVAAYVEGVTVKRSTSPVCEQCNVPLAVSVERLCWSCACWEEKRGVKR